LLYIVATPIGNLEDISQRALNSLRECDAILCEDTRRTSILLNRHGISKPLISYHKFKEAKVLDQILARLESGENLALVSDAGTPCINDPGTRLAAACVERNIPFTAIPGPCSVIEALVLSAFLAERFQFIGFLSKKPAQELRSLLFYPGATVAFESPERLPATLDALDKIAPLRPLAVAREMTKTFEECRRGTAAELHAHYQAHPPKGEIVLVIAPGEPPDAPMDLEECVGLLQEVHGLSLKEAIKEAARLLKVPKSAVYKEMHRR
jgi:16S rRNA (cytidine1402-2'-O)-methyltransferase